MPPVVVCLCATHPSTARHDADVLTMLAGIDLLLPLWCLWALICCSRNERRLYACRFWDLHRNATGTQFSRGAIDQWPTSCANSSMDDSIMWYMICVSPCYHFPERAGGWARECRPWGLSSSVGNECLLQQVSVQQIQRVQNMRRVLTIGTVVHKVLAKYFTSKHSTKPVAKPWLPSPQLYSKSEGVVAMFVPRAQTWHSWHLWYSQLKRNIWCGS